MKYSFTKKFVLFIFLFLSAETTIALEKSSGESLFKTHCKSCHEIGRELTGPDLSNINENRSKEWLIPFIRDSKSVINSGDQIAVKLFNDYKKVEMPPNTLTDNEITDIITFISSEKKIEAKIEKDNKVVNNNTLSLQKPRIHLSIIISSILTFLLIIAITIKYLALKMTKKEFLNHPFIMKFSFFIHLSSTSYLFLFIVSIVINISSANGYFNEKDLFSQAYEISQPVEFSHEVHFDTYKIDCIYCHVMAVSSNIANLPGNENCMKCHDYIRKGEKTGEKEITKLINFKKSGKNIVWEKGYRMKKHVHFNHEVHISTGNLSCTKCHEKTSSPEIHKSNVSMKWCIDCHKKTKIETQNLYYRKAIDTLLLIGKPTISELGGLDCNNCHY